MTTMKKPWIVKAIICVSLLVMVSAVSAFRCWKGVCFGCGHNTGEGLAQLGSIFFSLLGGPLTLWYVFFTWSGSEPSHILWVGGYNIIAALPLVWFYKTHNWWAIITAGIVWALFGHLITIWAWV